MKVCVLIPSYNGSQTIGHLIKLIKAKNLDVIVVDDGSVDATAEIAKDAGAQVIRNEKNEGKGASLQKGFRYILNQAYDAVITMDGDNQHSPEDILKFIDKARDPQIDVVVGNRMLSSKGMPLNRWLTNHFMSILLSLICWINIRDSQCGFRLLKKRVLKEINLITSNYEIESEIILAAHLKGFKIAFVPIRTIYAKQASQINPIVDTIRFFHFILKFFCPFLFNKK